MKTYLLNIETDTPITPRGQLAKKTLQSAMQVDGAIINHALLEMGLPALCKADFNTVPELVTIEANLAEDGEYEALKDYVETSLPGRATLKSWNVVEELEAAGE